MSSLVIDIQIEAEQYLLHYQRPGASILARARDGRSVRFPANLLQGFVTHNGISGSFEMVFDDNGKCQSITRVGAL